MIDYALYIGRFQPFHKGHFASVQYALQIAQKVVIILGGYQLAPSLNNPWTVQQRQKMILHHFSDHEKTRIKFIYIRDRLYNEALWQENVKCEVEKIVSPNKTKDISNLKIVIIGHMKDETSYYLKTFPEWDFKETGNFHNLNSTQFREVYFSDQSPSYHEVQSVLVPFLKKFRKTKQFEILKNEAQFFSSHSEKNEKNKVFSYAFILIGHYLLLHKKMEYPGLHLYTLPGLNEPHILAFCLQNKIHLKQKSVFETEKQKSFYYRQKEVSVFEIPFKPDKKLSSYLPHIKNYHWFLWDDFIRMENKMHEDHYQIIASLRNR